MTNEKYFKVYNTNMNDSYDNVLDKISENITKVIESMKGQDKLNVIHDGDLGGIVNAMYSVIADELNLDKNYVIDSIAEDVNREAKWI